METNINRDLIGIGVTFPIEITDNGEGLKGWYPVSGDSKLIENNLESLFLHQIGEKFRVEQFGTRLWECIEENNTQALSFLVNQFITEAINDWESRITYKSTTITRESSKLLLEIHYVVNATKSSNTGTLVYDSSNNTLNI